jgi:hypothetical protein
MTGMAERARWQRQQTMAQLGAMLTRGCDGDVIIGPVLRADATGFEFCVMVAKSGEVHQHRIGSTLDEGPDDLAKLRNELKAALGKRKRNRLTIHDAADLGEMRRLVEELF